VTFPRPVLERVYYPDPLTCRLSRHLTSSLYRASVSFDQLLGEFDESEGSESDTLQQSVLQRIDAG
jgi:hypothetical protein